MAASVIARMSLLMAMALFGNLVLVFVIFRGNAVSRQRISPVQLLLLHTCLADVLFALVHFYFPSLPGLRAPGAAGL